ncbi:hypothetical protein ABG067_004394 [Albugo candida]|uniref:Uncharacterized protein n=1 Tax=Albugo candida TaxID=65357 RepID=A0A024GSB5_9STRA|nr:unnamed protein product [Albugo candida]|eukprot:CCI49618.1 unnamed protein product [Albugo candida]
MIVKSYRNTNIRRRPRYIYKGVESGSALHCSRKLEVSFCPRLLATIKGVLPLLSSSLILHPAFTTHQHIYGYQLARRCAMECCQTAVIFTASKIKIKIQSNLKSNLIAKVDQGDHILITLKMIQNML